jgi:hypothetical protein
MLETFKAQANDAEVLRLASLRLAAHQLINSSTARPPMCIGRPCEASEVPISVTIPKNLITMLFLSDCS